MNGFADAFAVCFAYDVTFEWDKQTNDVVLAKTITSNPGDGSASETENYEIVDVKDASDAQIEAQVLKFHNERVKPQLDIYKRDIKTGALVAGAVYNLITVDDIYSATGDLLFRAGDLIATSAPTDENGHTTFTCDFPMRGEFYCRTVFQCGYVPVCPRLQDGQFIVLENPDERHAFNEIVRDKLLRCTVLVVCSKHSDATTNAEVGLAKKCQRH